MDDAQASQTGEEFEEIENKLFLVCDCNVVPSSFLAAHEGRRHMTKI